MASPFFALLSVFCPSSGWQRFHMYGTEMFIEDAGQHLKRAVEKDAIKEVKDTQAEYKVDVEKEAGGRKMAISPSRTSEGASSPSTAFTSSGKRFV